MCSLVLFGLLLVITGLDETGIFFLPCEEDDDGGDDKQKSTSSR